MELGLKGKVALVGGASRGIGRACATSLSQEGASVVVCARDEKALTATAEEIRAATHGNVLSVAADLSEASEIERLFHTVAERFGTIDVLVNNTGGPPPGKSDILTDENWKTAVERTLLSVVRCCRAATPWMKSKGWGRIVNIVSTSVRQPIETLVLSNSVRLAVIGYAKSLSRELGPSGITVNNVLPGRVDTDRYRELLQAAARREEKTLEQAKKDHEAEVPVGRFAAPSEIGDAVAFLCSEKAAYINGVSLAVDGGLVQVPI